LYLSIIDWSKLGITLFTASLFAADVEANAEPLRAAVEGQRVLVVGAAGSIGQAFVKQLLPLRPGARDRAGPESRAAGGQLHGFGIGTQRRAFAGPQPACAQRHAVACVQRLQLQSLFAGISLFASEVLDLVPAGAPVSLEREILPRLARAGQAWGWPVAERVWDIGTPQRYAAARAAWERSAND